MGLEGTWKVMYNNVSQTFGFHILVKLKLPSPPPTLPKAVGTFIRTKANPVKWIYLVSGTLVALYLFFLTWHHHWAIWEPLTWSSPHLNSESPSPAAWAGLASGGPSGVMLFLPGSPGPWNILSHGQLALHPQSPQYLCSTFWAPPTSLASFHLLQDWDPRHLLLPKCSKGQRTPTWDSNTRKCGDETFPWLSRILRRNKESPSYL